ncbi:MAG: hypothetical protein PHV06_12625 [bacterium]|nr:hypothetical protein [bacterium]
MRCEICGLEFKSLGCHLSAHNITTEEYYIKYLKKEEEGFCFFCGNATKFKSFSQGFRKYCNERCSGKDSWQKNYEFRKGQTRKAVQTQEYRKKVSEIHKKRWHSQNSETKQKIRKHLNQIRELAPSVSSEEFKNKMLEKYGVDNIFKSSEFKNQMASRKEEIQKKKEETSLSKYGVKYFLQCEKGMNNYRRSKKNKRFDSFLLFLKEKNITPLFDKSFFVENVKNFEYFCEICKKAFISDSCIAQNVFCPESIHKYTSQFEFQIKEIITEWGFNVETNKRFYIKKNQYLEIDVFIPELNVGIEFNGLYWHSELFKDKDYHQKKMLFFANKGIKLFQIFEDSWVNEREVVLELLKTFLPITAPTMIQGANINTSVVSYSDFPILDVEKTNYRNPHILQKNGKNLLLFNLEKTIKGLIISGLKIKAGFDTVNLISEVFKILSITHNERILIEINAAIDSVLNYLSMGWKIFQIQEPQGFFVYHNQLKRHLSFSDLHPSLNMLEQEVRFRNKCYMIFNAGSILLQKES